jgi:hypothetical protein
MNRLFNAIANRIVFANRKNRVEIRKAKTSKHAVLHAHAVHALYCSYGALRGLLATGLGTHTRTDATAWQADCSTQPWCSWMSAVSMSAASMPCQVVRRRSPAVVVVA